MNHTVKPIPFVVDPAPPTAARGSAGAPQ